MRRYSTTVVMAALALTACESSKSKPSGAPGASAKPPTAVGAKSAAPSTRTVAAPKTTASAVPAKGAAVPLPAGDDCIAPKSTATFRYETGTLMPKRQVTLEAPGSEPRTSMRYRFTPGGAEWGRYSSGQSEDETPKFSRGGSVAFLFRVRCKRGDLARIEVSVEHDQFSRFAWYVVSPTGQISAYGVGAAPGQQVPKPDPDFLMAVRPLPDKPVGKGARFRVDVDVPHHYAETYTVSSIDGGMVKAKTQLKQPATKGSVAATGTGEVTFHFESAVPAYWTWQGNPKMSLYMGVKLRKVAEPKPLVVDPVDKEQDKKERAESLKRIQDYLDKAAKADEARERGAR